jgi:hypothetical protein
LHGKKAHLHYCDPAVHARNCCCSLASLSTQQVARSSAFQEASQNCRAEPSPSTLHCKPRGPVRSRLLLEIRQGAGLWVGVACDLYRTTYLLKVATRRGVVVVQAGPAKTVDGETYASIAADCRSLSHSGGQGSQAIARADILLYPLLVARCITRARPFLRGLRA